MYLLLFFNSVTQRDVKVRKLKCTLVQALRLCTANRGSRSIALLFLHHGARRGWGVSVTPWPLFTPRKDPVSIVQEAAWAPGPVWTGAENLASTRIRSPDRPAHSQSLYRLRYPADTTGCTLQKRIIKRISHITCILIFSTTTICNVSEPS